jgi:membrane-bound serine protease (ClpP class)
VGSSPSSRTIFYIITGVIAVRNLVALTVCVCVSVVCLSAAERPVIVVPVTGEIEEGIAAIVVRSIDVAEEQNAHAIILHMDTYGGKVIAAEKIMQALSRSTVRVYTYVDTKAISAGALIAAATSRIYMAPQSQIGDAKLMQGSIIPGMGSQEIDEGVKEKAYSAVRAMVRSACEKHGHPWPIFEAMMDEDISITNVIEEGKLLTLTTAEAISNKVAFGTASSLAHLKSELGVPDAPVHRIKAQAGEKVARFLTSMTVSGLLLVLGLGGLFIEIRTPGVGIPGIIGVICLALFFWGHNIAGMSSWLNIILFVAGIILILLEAFVIPGFGVTGISGIVCIFLALVLAMMDWQLGDWSRTPAMHEFISPLFTVMLSFIGAFALLLLTAKYLPAAPFINKLFLLKAMTHDEGYSSRNEEKLHRWIGRKGICKTTLRPAGKALIDDTVLDVVTGGDWIEQGTPVKVIDTQFNRIVVATYTSVSETKPEQS